MASVIKAGKILPSGTAVQHAEFNFEDISANASQYLDTVRKQVAQIVAQAQQQSQQIAAQAAERGRQAALEAARKAGVGGPAVQMADARPGTPAGDRRNSPAAQQLAPHTGSSRSFTSPWPSRNAWSAANSAGAPTFRSSGFGKCSNWPSSNHARHAPTQPGRLRGAGIACAKRSPVNSATCRRPTSWPTRRSHRGGCRVDTQFGYIDQQLATQLARIEEELTG